MKLSKVIMSEKEPLDQLNSEVAVKQTKIEELEKVQSELNEQIEDLKSDLDDMTKQYQTSYSEKMGLKTEIES